MNGSNTSNSFPSDVLSTDVQRKETYRIQKKICWAILAVITAIFIVLLVLTIYFGINQKSSANTEPLIEEPRTSSSTPITGTMMTTTTTRGMAPPVERIPTNLKPEKYHLTISPNLVSETFTGRISFIF